MTEMLFTVAEVSKILKCNVSFVHELRKAGLIPFLKLGSYKCRKEALEKFLADNEGKDLTDTFNVKLLNPNHKERSDNLGRNN